MTMTTTTQKHRTQFLPLLDFHTKTLTHTMAMARWLVTARDAAAGHREGVRAERTKEEQGLVLPSLADGVGGEAGAPGELYRNRVISV